MKRFHGTLAGWFAQYFPGNQLLFLGVFLLFYLVLSLSPEQILPETRMPVMEENEPIVGFEALDSLRYEMEREE